MHIHRDMFAFANAGWEPRWMQTGAVGQPGGGDADDADGSAGGANATSGTGGNPILQALAQALRSLGLSLESSSAASGTSAASASSTTTPSTAATASGTSSAVTDPTPSTASSSAAASATSSPNQTQPTSFGSGSVDRHEVHTIARDIRHVMRALFADVQAENTLAPANPGTGSTAAAASASASTPQSSFGSGLAALISQIQGGSVPANLASAFDKLVNDLEKIGGFAAQSTPVSASQTSGATPTTAPATTPTSTSTAASTAASTTASTDNATASPQPGSGTNGINYQGLLLQFLTNLQSDLGLGYGTSSSTAAQGATSGLMVNTLA